MRSWRGGYNAMAVLPQGASDVQSIRTTQTADPPGQADPLRSHTQVGQGKFKAERRRLPGSMTARRFHLGEVVESFLRQPLLAGLPQSAAALPRALPLRT